MGLPAGAIGRLGFRRWYERELLACHAWLLACLLCTFALFGLLDAVRRSELGADMAAPLLAAFASGAIAVYALQRYLGMLLRALHLSERSTCGRCGAFGRYTLVGATPRSMTVRCGKCASEWTID